MLKRIATTLQASFVRPMDLSARFGGEEFVVVLPSTPASEMKRLGDAVRTLAIRHDASTVGAHITISAGGASTIASRVYSFVDLLESADEALYEAKRAGKKPDRRSRHGLRR